MFSYFSSLKYNLSLVSKNGAVADFFSNLQCHFAYANHDFVYIKKEKDILGFV
jgi:hypothetical protein